MKTTYLTFLATALIVVTANFAQAQCDDWNWPEDKQTATEKNVLYDDYMKNGQYDKAVAPLNWLLKNAPNLNKSIYINGEKIFDNLASAEKNPEKKKVYIDSLMIIFDMRIKYCNDESTVLNRRSFAAYKYYRDDKTKLKETLDLFEKTFKINGTGVFDQHLVAYMDIIRRNKLYLKNLSDEEIIARYDVIIETADNKIKEKAGRGVDQIIQNKNTIDDILIGIVDVNCDFVKNNMAPKYKENPNDINLAKKIFRFMLSGKCTDDPLWMETGEAIGAIEPDFGLFKNLALKALSNGDVNKAESLFKKALDNTDSPSDKADMYLNLGDIESKRGNKVAARENYRKALNSDANKSEAWDKIGYLYYNSFDDCAEKKSQAKDRAVYLVAFEMFQRAGNTRMMNAAKEQFPSKDDIFLDNIEKGSEIKVNCWINETTKIQTRD
jgi:tetratricopeptide (TPR) repeat protein